MSNGLPLDMLASPVVVSIVKDDVRNVLVVTDSSGHQTLIPLAASVVIVDTDTARVSDRVAKFAFNAGVLNQPIDFSLPAGDTATVEFLREDGYAAAITLTANLPANSPLRFDNGQTTITTTVNGVAKALGFVLANGATSIMAMTVPVSLLASTSDRQRSTTLQLQVAAYAKPGA